jgi:PAS domain S-box-containing protein
LGGAIIALLENAALLLSVTALFELLPFRRDSSWSRLSECIFGVGLGCIGILLMMNPWLYVPGIVFDTRSVLVSIAGLFFGPVPTFVAMAMTAAYRYSQGGAATVTGIMVILSAGTLGLLWRHRRAGVLHTLTWRELYGFGLLVHIVMLCMMLYLPWEMAKQTLEDITVPVLVVYPLVTTIVGLLMVTRSRRAHHSHETRANEERLRLALAAGNLGTFDLDIPSGTMQVDAAYREMLGFTSRKTEKRNLNWINYLHPDDDAFVRLAYEDHVAGRRPEFREEFRLRSRTGESLWVQLLGKVVAWDERSRAKRMLGTLTNITARRDAETALRESEFQLRQLIAHSFSAIVLLETIRDTQGQPSDFLVTEVNSATEKHSQLRAATLVGKYWSQADPPSFQSSAFDKLVQVAASGRPDEWEARTDTQGRTLHVSAYRIGINRVAVVFEDITNRKRAEEALEREATRRRILVEQADDGIVVLDESRRVVEANRGFAEMIGCSMEEALTLSPWDWDVNYPTPETLLEKWPDLSKTPTLIETQWRRRDGSIIDVEISCNPVEWGGQHYHFDVCRDITNRKRADQVLRLQAAALGAAANAIVITNRMGTIEWVNTAWCDLTGYAIDEAVGQNPKVLKSNMHDRAFYENLWSTILSGRVWQSEIVNRRKDGTLYIEEEIITPVLDKDGEPTHFVGIKQDITKRKRDEETLRESEERFRRALVNAPFPSILHAEDGTVLEVSQSWCNLTGYSAEEISTVENWAQLAYGDKKDAVLEAISKLYTLQQSIYEGIFDIRTRSGEIRMWEFGSTPLGRLPDGRRLVLSMAMDVTVQRRAEADRNRLQAQLQQSQKMESVGRLAGGVAHDFNNMISAILGNAELALADIDEHDPLREHLEEIVRAAQRSADLTRQLLAFARRQAARPRVLDLNEVVENMLKMLQRLIGEDIDLNWRPGSKLWPVNMDPSQVDQILANLVVNARDAINGVGKLFIETSNVVLDSMYADQHAGFLPGEYVNLTVTDSGAGMDSATIAQIFEPFFTTKELHQGTGLGLATVYGVVKQNDGFINVYSELGKGSSFKVYFPRVRETTPSKLEIDPSAAIIGGTETLLVIEDEPAIRNVVNRVLSNYGYQVHLAATPEEALAIAADPEVQIELMISDVVLPGMNGKDLTTQISALRPGLPVLYMSGYTANIIAHHGVLDAGVDFIQKPFSISGLTHKIREVLDRAKV